MPERTDLPPVLETFGTDLRAAMHKAEADDAGRRESRIGRITRPAISRQRVRRRVLAGTTAGLVAAAAVLALALGATTSSPAFAVTRNADGTVSLTIKQLAGITGANAKLAAFGVRARAVPVVAGCAASPVVAGLVAPSDGARAPSPGSRGPRGALESVRIDPSKIPGGQTLVLAAKQDSHPYVTLLAQELVRGPVPACLGAPPPPPAPTPVRGSCHTVHNPSAPGRPARRPPSVASIVQLTNTGSSSSAGNRHHGNSGSGATACRVPPPATANSRNPGRGGSAGK